MHTSLLHSAPRSIDAGIARWPVSMRWQNLLFAHWPIEPKKIRPLLPTGLELDTYDGWAWIGIVPFHLTSHLNWMPFVFEFPEVNVRTYANYQGKTGVWFFSLDASSRLAVIDRHSASRWIRFSSRRTLLTAAIEMQYGPIGESFQAEPASLEHWLVERYSLFAPDRRGRIATAHVAHSP